MPPSHPRPTEEPTLPQKMVCHHDSKTFQHFPRLWSISLLHKHKKHTMLQSEPAPSSHLNQVSSEPTYSCLYKIVHRAKGRKHTSFRKSHPLMKTLINWQPNWFMGVSIGGTICAYFSGRTIFWYRKLYENLVMRYHPYMEVTDSITAFVMGLTGVIAG